MRPEVEAGSGDAVIAAVLELIDAEGYDAVQLREVARRAHVSLATIYKRFPTREALILAALQRWREGEVYDGLDAPAPDESVYDGLMRVFRHIFEPWEREPRMLEAFHRVLAGPPGDRLTGEGTDVVRPVVEAVLGGEDPDFVNDVLLILEHVTYGAIGRFVDGKLTVTEILVVIERAVFRLTEGLASSQSPTTSRKVRAAPRP